MLDIFKSKLQSERPKTLGQLGEEFAQEDYKKRGYEIVAANFFNRSGKRLGEIDFIAQNKKEIIFVEVKTRKLGESKFGSGAESVNMFKQIKLLKAVKVFLAQNPLAQKLRPQIDVCLVDFDPVDKTFKAVKILVNSVEDFG